MNTNTNTIDVIPASVHAAHGMPKKAVTTVALEGDGWTHTHTTTSDRSAGEGRREIYRSEGFDQAIFRHDFDVTEAWALRHGDQIRALLSNRIWEILAPAFWARLVKDKGGAARAVYEAVRVAYELDQDGTVVVGPVAVASTMFDDEDRWVTDMTVTVTGPDGTATAHIGVDARKNEREVTFTLRW